MALSKEENDMLTQVGPGKPAGELLRRYWQPIGFANELHDKPKSKRILGEDVVLFRDEQGKFGVLALRCMHRGTSLEFGHIESGGLRCCYHGWLYDVDGKVLETPGEPPASTFKERVRQPSYNVQELGGVLFVYMGPEPAPLLPRYDVLARQDGQRAMRARIVNCNYFQMIENSVDQNHLKWLHRGFQHRPGTTARSTRRSSTMACSIPTFAAGGGKKMGACEFFCHADHEQDRQCRRRPSDRAPASSSCEVMRWRVPIDDTRTIHYTVEFGDQVDGQTDRENHEGPLRGRRAGNRAGKYRWDDEVGWFAREDQDRAAQESQGAIFDRTTEHLVTTDKGVILLRRIYKDGMEAMQAGTRSARRRFEIRRRTS